MKIQFASGADAQSIIEKIDIGGISLIRAAAKNFNDVVIVASKAQYKPFLDIITENGAVTTRENVAGLLKKHLPFLLIMIQLSSDGSMEVKILHSVVLLKNRKYCAMVKNPHRKVFSSAI